MSARDMKNYCNYMEEPLKTVNEREEGEIVDEYDLIVSSDEELCMRQRIRELEAENEEIEQIAVISRSYVDKINPPHYLESTRAAQVPTDVSSISSTEFVTPQKHKRRKSKEHKRKHCHRQHQYEYSHHQYEPTPRYDVQQLPVKTRSKRNHCKRRQKLFAKKHKKIHSNRFIQKELNADSMLIESLESSDSSPLSDTDNYGSHWMALKRKEEPYNKEKFITRDTLRLAVARDTTESKLNSKKYCLKERLLRQEVGHSSSKAANGQYSFDAGHNIADNNSDDDVQVIENEPDIQTVDEDSTDSMEEKELRLIALKSAVLKKHMARKMRNAEAAYSPTDFDEMLSSGILRQGNKLDDIDVVDLEEDDSQTPCVIISPVASPQLMILEDQEESQQMVDCKPVDMDIANSDSDGGEIDSWSKELQPTIPKYSLDSGDFSKNIQFDFYMQNLHELPPPPPGVDDYEAAPPPPPYHMAYISDNPDMDLDNEEFTDDHRMENREMCSLESKKWTDNDGEIKCLKKEDDEMDDEEEEALRALLLSKFQSPRNQKKLKCPKQPMELNDTANIKEESGLNSYKKKPTEFILKEAVKRLKVHSQTEPCKEEPTAQDNYIKVKPEKADRKEDHSSENTCDSLNVIEKLKNRLNMYQDQTESKTFEKFKDDLDETNCEKRETAANIYNGMSNEHSVESNSPEATTSKIDISDITRRLQKIKEDVLNSKEKALNATCLNSKPQVDDVVPSTSCNMEDLEIVKESKNSSVELAGQHNKTISNDFVGIAPLAKDKTVKANFNVTTNETTFKVTIKNNAAFKTEENVSSNTLKDVTTYKDTSNNVKNVAKDETLTAMNENTKSKINSNSERSINMPNKSSVTNKSIKSDMTKVTPTPTYSLIRNTKIIKPNKIINATTNFDLNAKQISQTSEPVQIKNKTKSEVKLADNSRLITSIDQVKHMCKIAPFLINLQNSSNESSGNECAEDYDTLYKPLYDYNDNASPLSLNLESPSRTPLRSNSPIEVSAAENIVQPESEAIKLNRKVTFAQKENSVVKKPPATNSTNQGDNLNKKTPLAVRHLPAAAQSEYRKLVHRMKLLENKRKVANIEELRNESISNKKICYNLPATEDASKEKADKAEAINSTLKNSLVKKVLLRNAGNNTTTSLAAAKSITQIANGSSSLPSLTKPHRSNMLRSYENLYIKFGAGIVNNLNKSLKLVEDAKKAKVAKLKLENRLKELKAEMEILQNKHKEEQQKIALIYPNICTTNDVITSLKQKRSKVFKAALSLGKTLKGEAYRLNNDLKETITTKSNELAAAIKVVNSLKAQDVKNIEVKVLKSNEEEQLTDHKEEGKIEDCHTKSETAHNFEIKTNPIETTNNSAVTCSKGCQEEETKKQLEPVFKADLGGNTEFQNVENKDTNSQERSVDTGQGPDVETKLNNACSEQVSEQTLPLSSYISPLEHLRNIDSNVDPNGVICPYDLMGNCEDVACKYVHITTTTAQAKT